MSKVWCVRAGKGGVLSQAFWDGSFIANNWTVDEQFEVSGLDGEKILKLCVEIYKKKNKKNYKVNARNIENFLLGIQAGDYIITRCKTRNRLNLAYVGGNSHYYFCRTVLKLPNGEEYYQYHRRKVQWFEHLSINDLPEDVRRKFSTFAEVFVLSETDDLIHRWLPAKGASV